MRLGRDRQLAVALGVLTLGIALAVGAAFLPEARGYSSAGPRLFPVITAIGLIVLGIFLIGDVAKNGFAGVDEEAEAKNPVDWRAFAWISAGLIANGILIVPAGFVIAGTLLFVCTARGFNDSRYALNALIGASVAAVTYGFFNYVLGLNLPRGILPV